jgi:hypothetical protein
MTNTPETEQTLVTVTQEDIDALFQSGHPLSRDSKEAIEAGEWNHHYLLQALARHREQAQRTEPSAGEVERVARALLRHRGCPEKDCDAADLSAVQFGEIALSDAIAAIQAMRGGQGERAGIVAWLRAEADDYQSPLPGPILRRAANAIERGDFLPGEGRRR